jgi:glutathione peroxidase
VNGANTHPLYNWLKTEAKGFMGSERIKWNFTKFLISPEGKVVKRYGSQTKPTAIAKDIEALL